MHVCACMHESEGVCVGGCGCQGGVRVGDVQCTEELSLSFGIGAPFAADAGG